MKIKKNMAMLPFIDKQNRLIARLHVVQINLLERTAQLATNKSLDEITKRRKERRMWVQLIAVVKMRARALETNIQHLHYIKNTHSRNEKIFQTGRYLEDIEKADLLLKQCNEARLRNGNNLLLLGDIMKQHFIKLSREEYQAALSISDYEWEQHVKREKERDISTLVFVCRVGDEALCAQVVDEMIRTFQSHPKLLQRIRWKTTETFPKLS